MQFQKLTPEHAEDAHFDGGASCVLLSVTLWGTRHLTLFGKEDDSAEHDIENWPGTVYSSCLCPIKHQVRSRQV